MPMAVKTVLQMGGVSMGGSNPSLPIAHEVVDDNDVDGNSAIGGSTTATNTAPRAAT